MKIAVLTLEGCNEMDSFVAFSMLNRVKRPDWQVKIAGPGKTGADQTITSSNGVAIGLQAGLDWTAAADAVLVGSGAKTAQYAADADFMAQLHLDPARQVIAAQCSGALLLHAAGLLPPGSAICSDSMTRPHLEARGLTVLDQPFRADGNIATAGGCLASAYLATWLMLRLADAATAARVLHYVAPMGEKDATVARVFAAVSPETGPPPSC